MKNRKKVLILGAAGRDFHNFNTVYRGRDDVEVVAFTATQIMGIAGRVYPAALAGPRYPGGIPIVEESRMEAVIREQGVDEVVFAYSDVANDTVMALGSRAVGAGADFILLGSRDTMIRSKRPVIAICAVRTGCGKSQTTRFVADWLKARGKKVVAIRHPMPYGDLAAQRVQRFAETADLDRHRCTIEEREEYQPHIDRGIVVYAGVDYEAILREAEKEADIVIWDGGNNDTSFYRPDLLITVTDPFRAAASTTHHPGQTNFITADVILVNKVNTAPAADTETIARLAARLNPRATVVKADSAIEVSDPAAVAGKRLAVVEDGPTLTHGNMAFGAGKVAADAIPGARVVDPRPFAVGLIREAYANFPQLETIVPALGYSDQQIRDLEATLDRMECDVVLSATPADLASLVKLGKPVVRVGYELKDCHTPSLSSQLEKFLAKDRA